MNDQHIEAMFSHPMLRKLPPIRDNDDFERPALEAILELEALREERDNSPTG